MLWRYKDRRIFGVKRDQNRLVVHHAIAVGEKLRVGLVWGITAAFYGLRRSEVVGLKWDAIDFENKKISIQHTVVTAKVNGTLTEIARDKTKTKSSCRTLPLIPACEQMLKKMKKEQEQNRKVCGMGKRIRPDFLSQHFPDFLVSHKMKRIRFHDLRHSDISTTSNIYTHLDFSSKVSSANAIVSIFPENTKV